MRAFIPTGILLCTLGFSQQAGPNITPRSKETKKEEPVDPRRPDIRIDTTQVLIPVAVLDPLRKFVTGLDKENFKLFEDKVEQEIISFSSEDAPLSVCIVFDSSGSMGD